MAERAPSRAAGRTARGYAAFISYSHKDSGICDRLHSRLEDYAIPHSLVGSEVAGRKVDKRLGKVFRDRHDLPADDDLDGKIREALDASAALIVLCSPKAAASEYVAKEICYFKSLKPSKPIFAAIASGEPHAKERPEDECFPRALLYRVGPDGKPSGDLEPSGLIAADLRDKKDELENGSLKLIAGMLGIGLDDLVQREKKAEARRRRRAYMISGFMAVLAIGAVAGGLLALRFGNEAAAKTVQVQEELDKNRRLSADLESELSRTRKLTTQITSVVGEISDIAASDKADVRDEILFLASGAKLGMSGKALKLVFDFEFGAGTSDAGFYREVTGALCFSVGYCLDSHTKEDFRRAWGAGFTPDQLAFIDSIDLKDRAAIEAALPALRTMKAQRRDAVRVFGDILLPEYSRATFAAFSKAKDLHPDCVGALLSISYNMGPNSGGLKPLREMVAAGQFDRVPGEMRRIAARQGERVPGLARRRLAEAQLFEDGLKAMQQPASAPS